MGCVVVESCRVDLWTRIERPLLDLWPENMKRKPVLIERVLGPTAAEIRPWGPLGFLGMTLVGWLCCRAPLGPTQPPTLKRYLGSALMKLFQK